MARGQCKLLRVGAFVGTRSGSATRALVSYAPPLQGFEQESPALHAPDGPPLERTQCAYAALSKSLKIRWLVDLTCACEACALGVPGCALGGVNRRAITTDK